MDRRHPIKRFLPKTLFGRALLILVAPSLLLQLFLIYQFYERHWDSVVRNMSTSLAGEVVLLYREYMNQPSFEAVKTKASLLGIRLERDETGRTVIDPERGRREHPEFMRQLEGRLQIPFMVEPGHQRGDMVITLLAGNEVLRLITTKKRLVSSTTYIFLLWSAGSSAVLLIIATLFLRNQVRPIRQLAEAAERFGRGQEADDYRPGGAREVRQAGRAFVVMQSRIARQVSTRTEMLAGISHDLRTPLTRLKLQLAMLGLAPDKADAMNADIAEMEHMIDEYLQFARGQQAEQSQELALDEFVRDVAEGYTRQGEPVTTALKTHATIALRPNAMKRALQNLIDNALRYGSEARISTEEDGAYLTIAVRDKGPGIPDARKDEAFRPFTRLDPSRSQSTSGAGLGLSICRDIVQAHGGTIELRNLKKGLEVLINLPRNLSSSQ